MVLLRVMKKEGIVAIWLFFLISLMIAPAASLGETIPRAPSNLQPIEYRNQTIGFADPVPHAKFEKIKKW